MSGPKADTKAAQTRRSRWPGWIWAVPVAAAGIVVWLGVRDFLSRGPEITISFTHSAGIQAGTTNVRYRGVNVGKAEDVVLAKDLSHVVITLRMRSDVADELRQGTRFWVVGPSLNLASLQTLIGGPYIEMDPGPGKPERHFVGLEQPLHTEHGPGTRFALHAATLGSLRAGSTIDYLGLEVGSVESLQMRPHGDGFDLVAFVRAPYDKLVHSASRFWTTGGIKLGLSGGGVNAQLPSLGTLVSGGIAFDTPQSAAASPPSPAESKFEVYPAESLADAASPGETKRYRVVLDGAVGQLSPGTAVKLRGFKVGEVTDVALDYDAKDGKLETPVTIALYPDRFGDVHDAAALDAALDRLIHEGLRAKLGRDPPVIGGSTVTLDFVKDAPTAALVRGGRYPEIPSAPATDIAGLTSKAQNILDKIDALPLSSVAQSVQDTIGRVRALVDSPDVGHSLEHLKAMLANLDAVSRDLKGKVRPVIDSLKRTADAAQETITSMNSVMGGSTVEQDSDLPHALHELASAARSLRALASYLERHPEALVQGKTGSGE